MRGSRRLRRQTDIPVRQEKTTDAATTTRSHCPCMPPHVVAHDVGRRPREDEETAAVRPGLKHRRNSRPVMNPGIGRAPSSRTRKPARGGLSFASWPIELATSRHAMSASTTASGSTGPANCTETENREAIARRPMCVIDWKRTAVDDRALSQVIESLRAGRSRFHRGLPRSWGPMAAIYLPRRQLSRRVSPIQRRRASSQTPPARRSRRGACEHGAEPHAHACVKRSPRSPTPSTAGPPDFT